MINIIRHINAAEAGLYYLASTLTYKPIVSEMPLAAGIETTNYCNLRCPQCSSGSGAMTRTRGFMKEELFDKFISETGKYLYYVNLYFQGEPMLHPGFFSFIERSGKSKIIISTNGHFLSEENCYKLARSRVTKLIISLDGMDDEAYSRYRINGEFGKVIYGIRNISGELQKVKSKTRIEIQFLVNRFNESQIPAVKRFAEEMHADLKLKSMQINDGEEIEDWLPENEKYRRYRKNINGTFDLKSTLKNNCFRLWISPVITWDGKVIPCCFDKNADHIMGDLNEQSFREIWNGQKFREFRSSVLKERRAVSICCNCTSGLRT